MPSSNSRLRAKHERELILNFLETCPNGVTVKEVCEKLSLPIIRTAKRFILFQETETVIYLGRQPRGVWVLPKYEKTAREFLENRAAELKKGRLDRNNQRKRELYKPRPKKLPFAERPITQKILPASVPIKKPKVIISSVFDLALLIK